MKKAEEGNKVKVHYTGKLEDGSIFDTSREKEPLEFKLGEGQVLQSLEQEIIGMEEGEEKTANIPSDKAYGPYKDELIFPVSKDQLPDNVEPQVGDYLQIKQEEDGKTFVVRVVEIKEDKLLLDANHPLAGKDLTLDIKLEEIF